MTLDMTNHMGQTRAMPDKAAISRQSRIDTMRAKGHYSVVVVGAGINGLGAFHDLCQQGIDCLIVDRGDFCSGTSAAPSRMIHGGLKYLETGDFRLVQESVRERNRLLKNAPHLVRPLEMILPIETLFGGEIASLCRFLGGSGKLKRRGRMIVKAGLAAYDFYSRRNRVAPKHRMISGWDLRAAFPGINHSFRYAASYFDAQITMPERLGVELAQDGMAANPGSIALNHCNLMETREGKLVLRDEIAGERHEIRADLVVNATGPWIDAANTAMGARSGLIAGAKGSHILLDLPALHDVLAGRMIYFDPGDGRICLVTSLAGRVLLGSTDIPVEKADDVACDDGEVDYMFAALRSVFPKLDVTRSNIVFTYSGVRPLPISNGAHPDAVTRDHSIHVHEPSAERPYPILSLIGGKWTTYRAFAAEAGDAVLKRLGKHRRQTTEDLKIGGGRGLSAQVEDLAGLAGEIESILGGDRARAWALVSRYGSRAREVASLDVEGGQTIPGLPGISEAEIVYIAEAEMCESVSDLVLRRLPLALSGNITLESAGTLVAIMARVKGWTPEENRRQITSLSQTLLCKHRIDLKTGKFQ
ncbi:glycerol-3-phosphate dehydrogenase/oxidase [Pelagibius litoralis]|uniref:Glycerol-3-phosphate dehydrogenase/oxidase n=1 Tax=Pelagibius litoralis TaxID=374515 RepID=A0A967K780_9PROT|nr:glycerol-3-phosphate dehydrogenase/oxidase [Pelagibius litoralis]NIA69688.1 glycerol-3-phosphate dehydrogenase/oxidase [Pelagibius litoralis]